MVIGIDGNEANVNERVGVSVYALNLLHYFKKQANKDLCFKVFLKSKQLFDLPDETPYFKYVVVKAKFLWSQIFLPIRLYQKRDIDIFFSPAHYGPRFLPVPLIVTIHDLSYIYYPDEFLKKDLYQLKNWTKYSVKKAHHVIAVSKTTKKDLIDIYQLPEEKVTVVYNGYEKYPEVSRSKLKVKRLDHPYILYVGTLQPRKNIIGLIKAFQKINQIYPQFELIIAGRKGWLYQKIFDTVAELGLENAVFFTDFISDPQLVYLYQNAFCLVMPSLYEGFGLPVLEAMSFGCPVICSFASSLPEIGGDACFYFDPTNINDLVEKILKLKNSPTMRKEMIKKGRERVKQFSWEACAEKTLEIIKDCLYDCKNYR